ncbi:MAG TPA: SRPBCC domain-containing protein [Bacteroidia bacterium]|nr:SRPBCC domain-containing protein [Bacteroidia bacterium]
MSKTITQKIIFKNARAHALYSMFLNSSQHTKMTGNNPAKISAKEGALFSAHGGYCWGKNIQLVKDKLIVQSWRAGDWKKSDMDSTFILSFEQKKNDAVLTMIHANVPDNQAAMLKNGWVDFYWKPWKKYLEEK